MNATIRVTPPGAGTVEYVTIDRIQKSIIGRYEYISVSYEGNDIVIALGSPDNTYYYNYDITLYSFRAKPAAGFKFVKFIFTQKVNVYVPPGSRPGSGSDYEAFYTFDHIHNPSWIDESISDYIQEFVRSDNDALRERDSYLLYEVVAVFEKDGSVDPPVDPVRPLGIIHSNTRPGQLIYDLDTRRPMAYV